ncbi:unnamed protein product [Caenorhabditis bovis]|nr:unnamed protein product [Caenorhabditis bovis]
MESPTIVPLPLDVPRKESKEQVEKEKKPEDEKPSELEDKGLDDLEPPLADLIRCRDYTPDILNSANVKHLFDLLEY